MDVDVVGYDGGSVKINYDHVWGEAGAKRNDRWGTRRARRGQVTLYTRSSKKITDQETRNKKKRRRSTDKRI